MQLHYQAAIDAVAEVIGQAEVLAVAAVEAVDEFIFVGANINGSPQGIYQLHVGGSSWQRIADGYSATIGFSMISNQGIISSAASSYYSDVQFTAAVEGVTAVAYQAAIDAVAEVIGQDMVEAVTAVAERAEVEGRDPVEAIWEFLMYSEEEKEEEEESNEPAPQPETIMSIVIDVDFETEAVAFGEGIGGGRNGKVLLRISLITGQLVGHPQLLVFYDNDYNWNNPTQAVFLYPAEAVVWHFDADSGKSVLLKRSDMK